MAKFKVGDRARIVFSRRGANAPLPTGTEVVVTGLEVGENGELPYDIQFIPLNPEVVAIYAAGPGDWYGKSWQLEPLTPDLGSWEEIERLTKWKPQGVTA